MKTSMTHSPLMNSPASQNVTAPGRRTVLAGMGAMLLAGPASGQSVSAAEATITKVVNEVLHIINAQSSDATKIRQFEQIFATYADVELIGRSLLGPPWRSISAAERAAYITALRGYLARKYGKRFREFRGGKIEIVSSKNLGGRKGVLVETRVSTSAFKPFPVEWQVIKSGDRLTFFDIVIEGIRLLSAEKTEVRALLDRNGGSVSRLTRNLSQLG